MSDPSRNDWYLHRQYDWDDPETILAIDSETTLRAALEALVPCAPCRVALEKEGGPTVFVGVGGPLSGVLVFPSAQSGASVYAVPGESHSCGEACFLSEGLEAAFPAAALMPPAEAIEIVLYIFSNSALPDWVTWDDGRAIAVSPPTVDTVPCDDEEKPTREIPF
jgi:hypothetical protein